MKFNIKFAEQYRGGIHGEGILREDITKVLQRYHEEDIHREGSRRGSWKKVFMERIIERIIIYPSGNRCVSNNNH